MQTCFVRGVVLMSLAFFSAAALAQKTPTAPKPPETKPAAKAEAKAGILPEVSLSGVALADAINFLRDVDPNFQAVISYAPGMTAGGPTIQELKLKNVSTNTVLQVLGQAYPQLHMEQIAADNDQNIWMIHVDPEPAVPGAGPGGGFGGGDQGNPDQTVTTVYRLREIVDGLCHDTAGSPEDRKKARDAVLSLIQAALQLQEANGDVTLKLHEATETLVFKGSMRKGQLVAATLESLVVPNEKAISEARTEARKQRQRADELAVKLAATELQGALNKGAAEASEKKPPADKSEKSQPNPGK